MSALPPKADIALRNQPWRPWNPVASIVLCQLRQFGDPIHRLIDSFASDTQRVNQLLLELCFVGPHRKLGAAGKLPVLFTFKARQESRTSKDRRDHNWIMCLIHCEHEGLLLAADECANLGREYLIARWCCLRERANLLIEVGNVIVDRFRGPAKRAVSR
jgi:hypothetical protein